MSTVQGFPQTAAPMVDGEGRLTQIWYYFLQTLWNRTGQALARDTVFAFFNAGVPSAGAINAQVVIQTVQFEVDFIGSYAVAVAAATAATLVTVNKIVSGAVTKIGEVNFAAGSKIGVFTSTATASFSLNEGEMLELVYPNPADATLANIAISFSGAHTT